MTTADAALLLEGVVLEKAAGGETWPEGGPVDAMAEPDAEAERPWSEARVIACVGLATAWRIPTGEGGGGWGSQPEQLQ